MKPLAIGILFSFAVTLSAAAQLTSYQELGVTASEEEFAGFIGSPIHKTIIEDAEAAVVYRVKAIRREISKGVFEMLPYSRARVIGEKKSLRGEELDALRAILLNRHSYGSYLLEKPCGFNGDYKIDFRSHGFEVSFLICTSCVDIATYVQDQFIEFIPFEPSKVSLYRHLKTLFKDDRFTQSLSEVDKLLPEIQQIRKQLESDPDPFATPSTPDNDKREQAEDANAGEAPE